MYLVHLCHLMPCLHVHVYPTLSPLQGAQSGPNTPAEFVTELKNFDFMTTDSATEGQHGVIDKLRVSLSTNGLK